MKLTTLVYIENDGAYLMLHRIKKKHDINANKWIGIGGKIEDNESPYECAIREINEETGLNVSDLQCKGILTFILPKWENEICFLYTAKSESRHVIECKEGLLQWVNKENILSLNLWPGDPYFLKPLLNGVGFVEMKLVYDENDNLISVE